MRKLIIGLTALFMIGNGASSQPEAVSPGQEPNEITTRFGVLSVDENKRLLFKGQPLNPPIDGNNLLELGKVMSIGATDVVLVTDIGGSGCPYTYYFVTISESGAKGSPFFGSCGALVFLKRKGDSITLVTSGFRGPASSEAAKRRASRQRHIFVYRAGVVTYNGKPVK